MSTIASTFDSQEPLLEELLRDIHHGKIQLPDFQRPWVWDDERIRSLLASVSLSYPIGAIMFLQTGGSEVRFRPRPVEGVVLNNRVYPEQLILDGQQRLTSLYGAIMGTNPVKTRDEKGNRIKRWYYIDTRICLDPQADRIDAVISVPEDKCIRVDFGRKIVLDLTTRGKEFENGMVPVNLMLNPEFTQWMWDYVQYYNMDQERAQHIKAFNENIWMRFQKYKVPVIRLSNQTPKEAVCQVFEKVNTGGVSLTVFELMTATYAADDFLLRKDWEQRRDDLHEFDVLKPVGGTELLQIVTLLTRYEEFRATGRPVSVKRGDVLNLSLEQYRENADRAQQGLVRAARLLNRERVFDSKNLPYSTQLVPLAAVCGYLGGRFEEDVVRSKLTRWYWCGVFGEMYGGANETRYAMDLVDLLKWILDDGPEPRTIRDADFAPMRLLTLQSRQSAAYKGLFALMVQKGSLDFVSGDEIVHTTDFQLPVDIHHIFPKAWCTARGIPYQKWNSVINKTPLASRTNRILGGSGPSQYIEKILRQGKVTKPRLEEILSSHWISMDTLMQDDFGAFMRERAIELLNAIERRMGKHIQGRGSEDVVQAFGARLESTKALSDRVVSDSSMYG